MVDRHQGSTGSNLANRLEPALADTGELMLLKHNYLDGWLQTYIVDLQERRLPEYADMYAIRLTIACLCCIVPAKIAA